MPIFPTPFSAHGEPRNQLHPNICGDFCLDEQMKSMSISWRNCEINCVDIHLGRKQLTQLDRVMMVTENSEALEKVVFISLRLLW